MTISDGMVELWTVERPDAAGVFIDDLYDTEEEAQQACAKLNKGREIWSSTKINVPYTKSQ